MSHLGLHVYQLLLDTNIFRFLCSSDAVYKTWFGMVRKHFRGDRFQITVTPFTILEGIGIRPVRMKDAALESELENIHEIERAKEIILDRALQYYGQLPEVSLNFLREEAEKRATYFTGKPRQLFLDVMRYAFDQSSLAQGIHLALAVDEVGRFPLPKHLQKERYMSAMVDIYRGHHHDRNFSQYRAMQECWVSFLNRHVQKLLPDLRPEIEEFNRGMLVEAKKDYLDTEIVSISCDGYRTPEGVEKVYAFTCDSPEVIKKRCAMYSFFLKHTFDMVREGAVKHGGKIPFNIHRPVPGNIIFCRSDGSFISMHKTKKLPNEMIPFLGLKSQNQRARG
jgi:hypothetical protein